MPDIFPDIVPGMLDLTTWELVQRSIPVPCVDIFPIRRAPDRSISHLGLIRRVAPFAGSYAWCHVGGRMMLGEDIAQALERHSVETLGQSIRDRIGADAQPDWVMEYKRSEPTRPQDGWDPRKHAISLMFAIEYPEDTFAVVGGEGVEFRWFARDELDTIQTWPGSLAGFRRLR